MRIKIISRRVPFVVFQNGVGSRHGGKMPVVDQRALGLKRDNGKISDQPSEP